jgi:hypothetical protein
MEKMKYAFAACVFLFSLTASAWEDCPSGLINDTYPGDCGRYTDTNADSLCDYSQTRPTTTTIPTGATTTTYSDDTTTTSLAAAVQKPATGEYNFIPICAGLLFLYLVSDYLSRRGILLGVCDNRRIWNVLLFFTFFAAGITGILIALRLDQRWDIPYIRDLTFWHVETGISMTLIAFFHCAWHWKYYLTMIKRQKKEK